MPELPDVEMARRKLERWLRGGRIVAAASTDRVILRPLSPPAFGRALVGLKVTAVTRRGKWLRLSLAGGTRVFSHLGMTGDWVRTAVDAPPERFERARFDVARGRAQSSVRYVDARRFGRLLVATDDIAEWRALGPDPMSGDLQGTLAAAFTRRRRTVKEALMDQSIVAGIGNILATEGLWRARLDPRSRTDAVDRKALARLVRGLRTAIRRQLASRERAGSGEPRDDFAAYGRDGQRCRRCGWTLRHIVLGGRGTTFCEHCQVRLAE